MNEMRKTGAFLAAALGICLLAWLTKPGVSEQTGGKPIQKELFPDFKSALDAASLSISEVDPATAQIRPFQVAKIKGQWVIPSHNNYPTDAKDQLASVAGSIVGLRVLGVEGDTAADHAKFGVIAPLE